MLLVSSVVTQSVPTCVTPPSGMVSWWPAEGDANDIQDGNDGTLENGAGFASGEVGQAFSFNGSNQDVLIGDPANLKLGSLTVDAWVNPNALAGSSGSLASIITKWNQQFPGGDAWALWLQNNGVGGYTCASDVNVGSGESGVSQYLDARGDDLRFNLQYYQQLRERRPGFYGRVFDGGPSD
jgi:hypothetical protein